MLKKISFLVFAAALVLAACSPATSSAPSRSTYYDQTTGGVAPAQPSVGNSAPASEPQGQASGGEGGGKVLAASDQRLVIKNANLALVVKDPASMANTISTLAEGAGGFVVNSNITQLSVDAQGNKILSGQIAVRVPADKLNDILEQIKAQAISVKSENVTGEDVTAQYVDLQSQLTNLQAEATQLQKIMDGATKTEDVLAVYQQLASVQGQIETIKGQMKYYTDSARMSLISVTLEQDQLTQPIDTGGWKPAGVLKSIQEAWVGTYQVVATLVLWGTIYCLPIVLVLGLLGGLIYLVGRSVTRSARKAKKAPSA
jgi:hypothetical protein